MREIVTYCKCSQYFAFPAANGVMTDNLRLQTALGAR